ncbi:Flagellar basal-body rod protein FlgG [Anatilimnocola aggregata]|uniref:Flagellar basal-body rod protein FlgG n=1 Tax=Anatilimnocola aggregata TaxID=2528021 RepID=A0A517YKU0_9BACT|nr:flagellar hook-basal body protein [Anatilimnocola aggregata]QDU30841.1 Flagellar basal-body rod protein FlgG [Anatilimnocola aggregata]
MHHRDGAPLGRRELIHTLLACADMYYGLYTAAAGANALSQKVEVLSNNLANVDTIGFKRELALLHARESAAIELGQDYRGSRSRNDLGGGVDLAATATEFGLGNFKSTGMQTDMALEQPNMFFMVQRGDEQLLTRAGNFQFNNEGQLQTGDGDAVLSADGTPIQLDPTLPWHMLPGGRINQAGDITDIGLRRPTNLADLQKVGQNYFKSTTDQWSTIEPEDRRVRSGFTEVSGVNSLQEMTELIATSRAYETNIRMMQTHDQTTGSLISRLLRPAT